MPPLATPRPADLVPPDPLEPIAGAVVDAGAPTFAWKPVPGATAYRLQIAPDRQFARDVIEVDAGPAARLDLFDTLPPSGATLFWRVRAETPAGPTRWSPYGRFVPAADTAADAYRRRQEAERAEARRAQLRQQAEAQAALDLVPFWQRPADATSDRTAHWVGLTMAVSFVLTFLLILAATFAG